MRPGNRAKTPPPGGVLTTLLLIHPVWDLFRSARNEF
jgi:hypothetical protein